MKKKFVIPGCLVMCLVLALPALAQLPAQFDLRDVDGVNYVTRVKTYWCTGG